MRTGSYGTAAVLLLVGAMLACGAPKPAEAGVDVGVSVNIGPPPIVAAEPPELVLVPRTQVYFVPGLEFDVFFHNGYWWSLRGQRWYRARAYNGPWGIVERRLVPGPIIGVPRDYRNRYGRERHIPYGQWKKEWSRHEGRNHHGKEGEREHSRER